MHARRLRTCTPPSSKSAGLPGGTALGERIRELLLAGDVVDPLAELLLFEAARSQLVAATGLTRTAIRGLVGELADAGIAEEAAAIRKGTPGRPSPVVRIARVTANRTRRR